MNFVPTPFFLRITEQQGGLTGMSVHGNRPVATMQWRNKPLLRRAGDVKFKTGKQASEILNEEVRARWFRARVRQALLPGQVPAPSWLLTLRSSSRSYALAAGRPCG